MWIVKLQGKLLVFCIILGLSQCEKVKELELPQVRILEISDITQFSVSLDGLVIDFGGDDFTSRGIIWYPKQDPWSWQDETILPRNLYDSFSVRINGLFPGETYYIKAFAENLKGRGYSDLAEFNTINQEKGFFEDPRDGRSFNLFPDWEGRTVQHMNLPNIGIAEWDTSRITEGILSITKAEIATCDFDASGRGGHWFMEWTHCG